MKEAFDEFADDYDAALARGVSVSGEDKEFFARGRIAWLDACLRPLGVSPRSVLDFGCGTGGAAPLFLELLGTASVIGVDNSTRSVDLANQTYGEPRVRFAVTSQYRPTGDIDIAFCNGVFHHIPRADRAAALHYVRSALRADGLFALWENNPWNPGTRYVMSRIAFDRDADMLSAPAARRLLKSNGFEILRTDFLFIFPRVLKALRPIEPHVCRLPLGGQYQVLCRRR